MGERGKEKERKRENEKGGGKSQRKQECRTTNLY